MSWILLSISSYLLNAVASIVDKILVSKKIPHPLAYTFYVGLLSVFVLIFAPFGLKFPPANILIAALASGAIFLASLNFLFKSLVDGEPSRVFTGFGALTPFFTLILSAIILDQRLTLKELSIFALLTASGLLILESKKKEFFYKQEFRKVFIAAFLFALSLVLAKFVYINHSFLSGFIWTRLGSFFAALFLLVFPENRKRIFKASKNTRTKHKFILVANKVLAGISFILLNYAISNSKGNICIISAMKGIEYGFIFILAIILSYKFPRYLKEHLNRKTAIKKIVAILLIGIGLW
ncbi:MAG: EamA family transporter, partial [bacterium]